MSFAGSITGLVALLLVAAPAAQSAPDAAEALPLPAEDSRDALYPRLAVGSDTVLLTWQMGRNYAGTRAADILALTLGADGRPVGKRPLTVTTDTASQERPRAAYARGTYLVVWQDLRNDRDWDVYGARITADGRLRDPDGFAIARKAGNQALPVVAPADDGFLVVWQDRGDGPFYRVHAAFVGEGTMGEDHAVLYQGPAQPGFWGYTPGWGLGRQPLVTGARADRRLTGGNLALARLGDGWLLSWNDESNWTAGGGAGSITRRFARLVRRGDQVVATAIARAPANAIGPQPGAFAVAGDVAFYTTWRIAGRGQRVGSGVLFGADAPRPLPNPDPDGGTSAWYSDTMIRLFMPPLVTDGPLAAAPGDDHFLVVARGSAYSRRPQSNTLFGTRLTIDGRRLEKPQRWTRLYQGERPIANPVVASLPGRFLVVFQEEDAAGRQQLRLLRVPAR